MTDVNKVKEAVMAEVQREKLEDAKKRYKAKMVDIDKAKKVLKNLERELADLEDELEAE